MTLADRNTTALRKNNKNRREGGSGRSLLALQHLYELNCSALINVSELQPRMRAYARMLQH